MLVNLSNHPSAHWPEDQKQTALSQFGTIKDMPHPDIDPECAESEILKLAEQFANEINALTPDAVHIMGEHTFVYALVGLLQTSGIRCIASTTARISEQQSDGSVIKQFRFVRFRDYPENIMSY